ncbi:MAG: hypothetical protein K0R63_139 [Rickettsiales bacterium]|jgi:predicted small lipoprotein YifL|nr:hypothetical protein [Rickettsiales bacterium]
MLKRFCALAIVVSALVGLAACGVKGDASYPGGRNVPGKSGKSDSKNWVK